MDLKGIRGHVADRLNALLMPRSCEPFGGTVNTALVKSAVARAPAIRVGVTRVQPVEMSGLGRVTCQLRWAALVVTAGGNHQVRDDAAMDLMLALVAQLGFQRWELGDDARSIKPDSITASNLYSGPLDRNSTAIWRIDWDQYFTLDTPTLTSGEAP